MRHDGGIEILKTKSPDALTTSVPDDLKPHVSADLRRSDREWLVDDHHVEKRDSAANSNFCEFYARTKNFLKIDMTAHEDADDVVRPKVGEFDP